jgi:hypothetical protein
MFMAPLTAPAQAPPVSRQMAQAEGSMQSMTPKPSESSTMALALPLVMAVAVNSNAVPAG